MKKGKNSYFKWIILSGLILGIVLFVTANGIITGKQYKQMDNTVKEIVNVHLNEMLGNYVAEKPQVHALEKNNTTTTAVSLLKEDQQAIIDSILGVLEPQIYKDMNSLSTTIKTAAIKELEKKLSQTIDSVVEEKLSETVIFNDQEKAILTNSIITVVEKDILAKIEQSKKKNEEAITILKQNIETNITNMENILKDYETKLYSMKTSMNTMETQVEAMNVENNASMDALKKQLEALKASYNSFQKEYAVNLANTVMLGSIVADITDPEGNRDDKVLAASVGYQLDQKIADLRTDAEKKLNDLAINITENIEQQINVMDQKLAELEAQAATKAELEAAKASLETADNTIKDLLTKEEADRIAAIEDARAALEEAITTAGTNASDQLKQAKDELQQLIDENVQDINTIDEALQNAQTAIEDNKTAVDRDVTVINNNISLMSNDITNLQQNLQQISDGQPIYTWSTENGMTKVSIEIQ